MEKLKSILFSTRLMAMLFLVFAIAMGIGTFIESKYNTTTARILIYNAWWFEAIMLFFVVNFVGNIKRYQLFKKEKWATLMLHLSFIFIIVGAAITRYISYEGVMPIREGASENHFYSDKVFLSINVDGLYKGEMKRRVFEKPVLLSQATNNSFSLNENFDKIPFEIELKNFIMDAKETIKEDKNGVEYLKMVESGGGTRHEHFLKSGEVVNIHNVLFSLNKITQGAININTTSGAYTINTPFEGQFMRMADKLQGKVTKDATEPLMMRSLYNVGGAQFVFPEPAKKGVIGYESSIDYKSKLKELELAEGGMFLFNIRYYFSKIINNENIELKKLIDEKEAKINSITSSISNFFKDKNKDDAIVLSIKSEGQEQEVILVGTKGKMGEPKAVKIGKLDYTLSYGSKAYELPFRIKLNDFIGQKYPGTEKSYSSFESQITIEDKPNFDYKIFMNHVLDHKGYRFFQSSFDPDEKGTVLSVNHDFWGTGVTYLGYFMLFFAMMSIMFTKHSRFADIKRKLDIVKLKKEKLLSIILVLFCLNGFAQNHQEKIPTQKEIDSVLDKRKISEKHAEKFGRLIIQDIGGRMKPVNTFSSELLRKVSHSDTYQKMNSDQVFVSMTQYPTVWYNVPLIYIKSGNDSIRNILGIDKKQKFAKFIDFFDKKGNYKLSKYLDAAYKTANPNNFEKDFVETDKKVNLMNSALSGSILRIFPIPKNDNDKWVSYAELGHAGLKGMDSTFTKQILPIYLMSLENASLKNNYKESDFYLDGIIKFQKRYGSKVMPSEEKITSEIIYNKYNILKKLFVSYSLASIFMLIFTLLSIFFESKILRIIVNGFHVLIGFLFGLHTVALIARWFISGHAPWSNAYEAIVYVAWATMFFGLAFDKKSKLTVASAAFVTAMIFMAADANWVDPDIANLQPVLNSYWLMIHVAVIVASYGPFALGMILGFVSLVLILLTNEKNKSKMELNIQEITYINEMALTIGLIMLTIGNFLGGQWANESWGRYWGWDPKETWALISIMVYAFVIHARFVPSLRGKWIFNLMSMFAFVSILFTYYGVNFHLVGLHSYASGEAKSLSWIWYSLSVIAMIGVITYPKYKKYYKK